MQKYKKEINFDKIKSFPIVEYASIIGLTPVKRGKFFTLKEHDSVRIKSDNWFYRNSNGAHGNVIDFACEFEGITAKEAIKRLSDLVDGAEFVPIPQAQTFKKIEPKGDIESALPKRDVSGNIKNIYAYLLNTRKISKTVVGDFLQNKRLYQDEHKNCVFVAYDKQGKVNFCSIRGTNTGKPFKSLLAENDYERCFYIPAKNTNSEKLIVTEAVIDSMSIMSLLEQKGGYRDYSFLSLASTSNCLSVITQLKENSNIGTVFMALDNDKAGSEAIDKVRNEINKTDFGRTIHFKEWQPKHKDWNDELKYIVENNYKADYFLPDFEQEHALVKAYSIISDSEQSEKNKNLCVERLYKLGIPKAVQQAVFSEIGTPKNANMQIEKIVKNAIEKNNIRSACESEIGNYCMNKETERERGEFK